MVYLPTAKNSLYVTKKGPFAAKIIIQIKAERTCNANGS